MNGAAHTGFMIAQTTTRNGSRLSTAKAFVRPVISRPNLHILLNTTVTRVIVDPASKVAVGVEFLTSGGQLERLKVNNEVIISAGE